MAVCIVAPVAVILPVVPAVTYRHYIGTTTVHDGYMNITVMRHMVHINLDVDVGAVEVLITLSYPLPRYGGVFKASDPKISPQFDCTSTAHVTVYNFHYIAV